MPELPEVETIRRGLEKSLAGKAITQLEVRNRSSWGNGNPDQAIGGKILAIKRQGKLILIHLSNDFSLTIHLKMTGQLIWRSSKYEETVAGGHPAQSYLEELPYKHTHIIFTFDDGSHLYFNDLRKFGRINLQPTEQVKEIPFLQTLGPEPLDKTYTEEYLKNQLAKRPKQPLKIFLLDQTNLAGLGNIYADESLFAAGLLPTRPAGSLSKEEIHSLYVAIPAVLRKAIEYGGSSLKDYVNAVGAKGTFLNVAQVYKRTGQPCNVCGTPIERIKLGGRSTHFCPVCQK